MNIFAYLPSKEKLCNKHHKNWLAVDNAEVQSDSIIAEEVLEGSRMKIILGGTWFAVTQWQSAKGWQITGEAEKTGRDEVSTN